MGENRCFEIWLGWMGPGLACLPYPKLPDSVRRRQKTAAVMISARSAANRGADEDCVLRVSVVVAVRQAVWIGRGVSGVELMLGVYDAEFDDAGKAVDELFAGVCNASFDGATGLEPCPKREEAAHGLLGEQLKLGTLIVGRHGAAFLRAQNLDRRADQTDDVADPDAIELWLRSITVPGESMPLNMPLIVALRRRSRWRSIVRWS